MGIGNRRQRRVAYASDLNAVGANVLLIVHLMAVVPYAQSGRHGVCPDITRRRGIGRFAALVIVEIAALGVARWPELLRIIGCDARRGPVVAVGADVGVDVKIVEEDKLARQLVMIRSGVFVEQIQGRIAIALADLSQHLIVGAVFLDDVNDVLDRRRPAGLRVNHVVVGELRHVEPGIVIWRKGPGELRIPRQRVLGQRRDHRHGSGLQIADVLAARVAAAFDRRRAERPRSLRIRVALRAASVQHQNRAILQHARRRGIPAGGNKAHQPAALLGNIGHRHRIGVGADGEQRLLIRRNGQSRRRHAQGLARRHGDVQGFRQFQVLVVFDIHYKDAIGVRRGHEQAQQFLRLLRGLLVVRIHLGSFGIAVGQHHIGGMRTQTHARHFGAGRGVVLEHRRIGPTGNEKRLAVGMEQDPIRPAAGFEVIHRLAGAHVDRHNRVVIQIRRQHQLPVGRNGHVTDEIPKRGLLVRRDFELARRLQLAPRERKLENPVARPSADVNESPIGRERQPEPPVRHLHPRGFLLRRSIDHADARRFISAVQHQHKSAVGRNRRRHRKRVQRHLIAHRRDLPAVRQQDAAIGLPAHRFSSGRLRPQGHRENQHQRKTQNLFHSENLCAMGNLRPMPKALVVTFRPGAACWRLYSLRSTLFTISFTNSSGSPCASAICFGARYCSI